MTVGSGWSVQRAPKAGDGFVLTAPGRVTKLRASSEQEELEVGRTARLGLAWFGLAWLGLALTWRGFCLVLLA